MKSAAMVTCPTDGATGQPLRAADVTDQASKLNAVLEADAMCADVPPDEPLDHELRYLGIWRAFLGTADDS